MKLRPSSTEGRRNIVHSVVPFSAWEEKCARVSEEITLGYTVSAAERVNEVALKTVLEERSVYTGPSLFE